MYVPVVKLHGCISGLCCWHRRLNTIMLTLIAKLNSTLAGLLFATCVLQGELHCTCESRCVGGTGTFSCLLCWSVCHQICECMESCSMGMLPEAHSRLSYITKQACLSLTGSWQAVKSVKCADAQSRVLFCTHCTLYVQRHRYRYAFMLPCEE